MDDEAPTFGVAHDDARDKEGAPPEPFRQALAEPFGAAYLPNTTCDTLSVREAGDLRESRRRSACLAFHNMRGSATK